ncbi:hypothetical protein Tco_0492608 [Tanacetum coccineum]
MIVCHEKVVEIPLKGSRKLRVQGERTLGAAEALMNAKIIKDSIKKTLPKFDKRVKKTLKAQVPEIVLKPLYKEFNALNKMKSTRIDGAFHSSSSQRYHGGQYLTAANKAATKGEKVSTQEQTDHVMKHEPTAEAQEKQVNTQGEQSSEQAPPISTTLVIQSSEEPPTKKLKFVLEDFPIPTLSPLNSIKPPVIINNIPFDQYIANLFSLGPFDFSPTLPPKVADKGIGIAQETSKDDQMKQLLPILEQGGSAPKISNLINLAPLEKVILPLKKLMLRWRKSKAKLAAYEVKREKMLKDDNHCISFIDDPLPIIKIRYRVANSTKEATIRIPRNNQPLNYIIYDKFILKMLGFSEWLELFDVPSKNQELESQVLVAEKKTCTKRKRRAEVIHEVFFKDNGVVDGMHRNLVPPTGVVRSLGLVIDELEDLIRIQNAINVNSKTAQDMPSVEDSLSAKHHRAMKDSLGAKHQRAVKDSLSAKPQRATSDVEYADGSKESQGWKYPDNPITL